MKYTICALIGTIGLISCGGNKLVVKDEPTNTVEPENLNVQDAGTNEFDEVKSRQEAEEFAYQTSLNKIDERFRTEYFSYKLCVENEKPKSKECEKMLKGFCVSNMMIDSRGGPHTKTYCEVKK